MSRLNRLIWEKAKNKHTSYQAKSTGLLIGALVLAFFFSQSIRINPSTYKIKSVKS